MANEKKIYTPQQALMKAQSYCAYQERSQKETRTKLLELGCRGLELENIIVQLIEDNFLNEERFAKQYARGKFNLKGWGKIRIKQGLKIKDVSAPLIKSALIEIDPSEYYAKLEKIISQKKITLEQKELNPYLLRQKLTQYAYGRGYETQLIVEVLDNLEI